MEVGGQRLEVGERRSEQRDGSLAQRRHGWRPAFRDLKIKDTFDLIQKIENGELPDKIMMNVHPQRWTNDYVPWVRELVGQNLKNIVKKYLIKFRDRSPQRHRGHREFLFF